MATADLKLSKGPTLEPGVDQGVHIIFVPPEVAGDPGTDVPPSQKQLDVVGDAVASAKETDVIVFAGRPWHLVNHKLEKHPEVHIKYPDSVLKVRVSVERAVWWSEEDFRITDIGPHHPAAAAGPPPFPLPTTTPETDIAKRAEPIYVARSKEPDPKAQDHEYKITFVWNKRKIDPNMKCI
jgi:hypothetical protein